MHCKSFTDDNKDVRWCPFRGCEYASNKLNYSTGSVVNCVCDYSYCFKCGQEQHRPADCDMFKQWEMKNSSESENINWILANCKNCPNPKCGRPIEKNQGCNHIQCKMCMKDFCWLCLGDWKDHNSSTGGYYKCNKFVEDKTENKVKKDAKFEL